MTKEKVIDIINRRIKETNEEIKRQEYLYKNDARYRVPPDYTWQDARINAFYEALELISMIGNDHNK